MLYLYGAIYPCVGIQHRYEICCDSSTRLALQYNIAKRTVYTSMYIDKPCVNFCNLPPSVVHTCFLFTVGHTD